MGHYFLRDYTISAQPLSYNNSLSEIELKIVCVGDNANFMGRLVDFLRQLSQEDVHAVSHNDPSNIILSDLKIIDTNISPTEKSSENKEIEKNISAFDHMEP